MIRFELLINIPLHIGKFNNYFSKSLHIYKYKYVEFEFVNIPGLFFTVYVNTTYTGEDHAGPELFIGIFQHVIHIKMYDCRHWDYEKNIWEFI